MGNKNRFSAMSPYPVLRVDTDAVRQNAKVITSLCEGQGIDVAGVIKFSDGSPGISGRRMPADRFIQDRSSEADQRGTAPGADHADQDPYDE